MSIFPTKIVLATDGSREAQLAASTATDLANSTNSELHLLCVAPGNLDPCLPHTRRQPALRNLLTSARSGKGRSPGGARRSR